MEGWLGEVEGLWVSPTGAEEKIAELQFRARGGSVSLGLPTYTDTAGRFVGDSES